ncbi:Alpha-(1,3)-fucosyltransferase 5 [Holothuria leucospilota]|uniref:Fucosyltransferase n=1 Tax=Holothuria leucospilota TaxID=206669 RepID=A0A9Q1BGM9_HOLLE|nr:Alpha-(1,3)-fucosyltransferase 5 [Holothuria leucospilota]
MRLLEASENRVSRATIHRRAGSHTYQPVNLPKQKVRTVTQKQNINFNPNPGCASNPEILRGNGTRLTVAFYEGNRNVWSYPRTFNHPPSPRYCLCSSETRYFINVTSEKDPALLKTYDLVFMPQDVGTLRIKDQVWDTILNSTPSWQRRLYATWEGPSKIKKLLPSPTYRMKAYHWSLSFHSKSDFSVPYGYYRPYDKKSQSSRPEVVSGKNWAKGKFRLAAWMSTWKGTSWRRRDFVEGLTQFINIDLYGRRFQNCTRNSEVCEKRMKEYKFYFAIENSCCSEYITEKFWRTLAWDVVPVVIGAPKEDYERLAPPNSFIYADDFKSPHDLAKYLKQLDENDDLYNKFFQWKKVGRVYTNHPEIQQEFATSCIPPEHSYYSCNVICKVTDRYLEGKEDATLFNRKHRYFDPGSPWWTSSCTRCGTHMWIRKYNN